VSVVDERALGCSSATSRRVTRARGVCGCVCLRRVRRAPVRRIRVCDYDDHDSSSSRRRHLFSSQPFSSSKSSVVRRPSSSSSTSSSTSSSMRGVFIPSLITIGRVSASRLQAPLLQAPLLQCSSRRPRRPRRRPRRRRRVCVYCVLCTHSVEYAHISILYQIPNHSMLTHTVPVVHTYSMTYMSVETIRTTHAPGLRSDGRGRPRARTSARTGTRWRSRSTRASSGFGAR
jgi:hypothetical protein